MRLVDADKTIGHIKTRLLETALNNCDVVCDASYIYTDCADNRIETWVDEMPTVDAVEVVRCKDCKYNYYNMIPSGEAEHGCTKYIELPITADFYCSWGAKTDEVEDADT